MRVLLLNQAFYPDTVATAQHAGDLAAKLAQQGHAVTVVASRCAYDDPRRTFPATEVWRGVRILRIPCLGLGKKARWRRALDFGSFLASCVFQLLRLPAFDVVVGMTSPPLISFLGVLFTRVKGGSFVFWVMDLNPDEAIAAGWLDGKSLFAAVLNKMLQYSLRRSDKVVVLDRYMSRRIAAKAVPEDKIVVIPPWSQDHAVRYDCAARRAFRERHELGDKYVVMYSGNHSPCHPLDTLLEAASRLRDHSEIAFCFVGGGSEFEKVKSFGWSRGLKNITCLPYQPLEELSGSLAAADLHVVVMGDPFVGIVHPCKIYNILVLGVPFLYIGPSESHIADLMLTVVLNGSAFVATHGDADAVVRHILSGARAGTGRRSAAAAELAQRFSENTLLQQMTETLQAVP